MLITSDELHRRIHEIAKQSGFDEDAYAFMAQMAPQTSSRDDPDPSRILLAHRADASMQPASTIKLLTSAVALDRLGPEHRGFTELRSWASLEDGRLKGDLWLIAGADPEFGLMVLWEMLVKLRAHSIRVIEGDLLVDRNRFNPSRSDQGMAPFDEAPEFPYNLIPDALSAHAGLQDVAFRADRDRVQVQLIPELPGIVIDNQLGLVDAPCGRWSSSGWQTPQQRLESDGKLAIVFSGSFPRQCTQNVKLQLVERNHLLEAQFRWLWLQLGGVWQGRLREVTQQEALNQRSVVKTASTVVLRHEARPWGEWLRPLNKRSDNALTRMLFLEIGANAGSADRPNLPAIPDGVNEISKPAANEHLSSFELADREIRAWHKHRGISTEGLVLENGSGLSRKERITARQMVSLLRSASREHRYHDLMMSLPLVGEDNTLKRRYTGTVANGSARLKTGSLWNVSAIAGVVYDRQQRPWMLSIMINHPKASSASALITGIVDTIANHESQ